MLTIDASFDVSAITRAFNALRRDLNREMRRAATEVAKLSAASSRQTHPFQNRSRNLERSITVMTTEGEFLSGTLATGTTATMHYASYVNDHPSGNFEFLRLGYMLERDAVARIWQDALDRAAASWI